MLNLRLLGPFDARLDDAPLPRLRSRKGQWLLALLALRHNREVDRSWLAATLWPDAEEARGLFYLRRELGSLRVSLGSEADRLTSSKSRTLRLNLDGANVDLPAFDAAAAAKDEPALERAVALYSGPLLEGCGEEWVFPEREAREQALLNVLEALAARKLARHEYAGAESHLRAIVTIDPLRESAHRALMQSLVAQGNNAAAVECYRSLRVLLLRELNSAPDKETSALFNEIRGKARQPIDRTPQRPKDPTTQRPARRIPRPLTELIGREGQMWEIKSLLATSRLVTLTGSGGIGKTRLAIQTAEELAEDFADGVFFVELAAVTEGSQLARSVVAVMDVPEDPGRSATGALTDFVGEREILLVLDNCEHLIDSCATLAGELLSASVKLRVLATSRQPLGITGETSWRVPSMELPPESFLEGEPAKGRTSQLMEYEAVRLFVERAGQTAPSFRLSVQNGPSVVSICRQLDGIPLALELAAARTRSFSAEQIATLLEDRFALLTGGSRIGLPRQQTLRASVDWSYDLLDEAERSLLRRLTVFAGGCTLEAAESVCGDELLRHGEVGDRLGSLVDKSLALFDTDGGPESVLEPRYRLLETVREYASQSLSQEESDRLRKRHAEYYLELVQSLSTPLAMPDQICLARLEKEVENLRKSFDAWIESDNDEKALTMTRSMSSFWILRGHLSEAREWSVKALHTGSPANSKLRADVLQNAAICGQLQGDLAMARASYLEALKIYQELGHSASEASIHNGLGNIARMSGKYEEARAGYGQALEGNRSLGKELCVAVNLGNLGQTAMDEGGNDVALAYYEEALEIARRHDSAYLESDLGNLMATISVRRGTLKRAGALLEESLTNCRRVGDRGFEAHSICLMGVLARMDGEASTGLSHFRKALAMQQDMGARDAAAGTLEEIAFTLTSDSDCENGKFSMAVTLVGAAGALRIATGVVKPLAERAEMEAWVARAQSSLGRECYNAAWSTGRSMSLSQAVGMVPADG